jgi:hypothetical protein
MRRLLATVPNFALLSLALAGVSLTSLTCYGGHSESVHADFSARNLRSCGPEDIVVYESDESPGGEAACLARPRTPAEVAEAREYLLETASPGYTMVE